MKLFKITFAYGGTYKGANIITKEINAIDKESAIKEFHKLYRSEIVYSVIELSLVATNIK